ncbi:MAG: DUF4352 domain-containing protein [Clostridiaceae bacterium]|nr:DUF4352 domain-containing protein [Clostridiaceae bacterium]
MAEGRMKKKKWWVIVIVVLVIIVFVAIASGGSDDGGSDSNPKKVAENATDSNDENDGTEEDTTQTEFAKGDVLETSNLKISYLDCGKFKDYGKYEAPDKGNKVVFATFEFENISDGDEYVSSFDFSCYADGYDCQEFYSGNVENLSATLSAGKKTKGTVLFEVPKDAKEITLEYDVSILTYDKVTFVIQ